MTNKRSPQKRLPTCPICQKGFFDCLIVDDEKGRGYHLECLEIKKEKEASPFLFSKVEQLEREVMAMKSSDKSKNREGRKML